MRFMQIRVKYAKKCALHISDSSGYYILNLELIEIVKLPIQTGYS